jgi:hypothetical protein
MSKGQKLSFFHFEGLSDEIILKILSLLDIKGVLQCGQVSKRLRDVSNDKSLWLKLNLTGREVPFDFIAKAVENGCEYLNLKLSWITGGKKLEVPWKLKYLVISQYCDPEWAREDLTRVLQNCHFLQKLAVDDLILNSNEIEHICQSGGTLRILSLDTCNINGYHRTELIKKLLTSCPQLTELNLQDSEGVGPQGVIGNNNLLYPHVCALVDNLPPNILKLNLSYQLCVHDKHVNTLVRRCKKITELDLSFTKITNDSLESIIEHLNSLEKLSVYYTNVDFSMLLQLKSIPTLKILRCLGQKTEEDIEKIMNLKLQLPHISINEEYFHIACPKKYTKQSYDRDWFWEIRAKQQDLFPSKLIEIDSSSDNSSNSSSELGSDASLEEMELLYI